MSSMQSHVYAGMIVSGLVVLVFGWGWWLKRKEELTTLLFVGNPHTRSRMLTPDQAKHVLLILEKKHPDALRCAVEIMEATEAWIRESRKQVAE